MHVHGLILCANKRSSKYFPLHLFLCKWIQNNLFLKFNCFMEIMKAWVPSIHSYSHMSVSYTHLDVYKRQPYTIPWEWQEYRNYMAPKIFLKQVKSISQYFIVCTCVWSGPIQLKPLHSGRQVFLHGGIS